MTDNQGRLVIAYDGSDAAQRAIVQAGKVVALRQASVVTVWEEALAFVPAMSGLAGCPVPFDPEELAAIEREAEHEADRLSREGAALARFAGFDAEPVACDDHGGIAETILEVSRARDAELIVLGSRGLGGVLRRLHGSTSSHVMSEAACPVLVVHDLEQ